MLLFKPIYSEIKCFLQQVGIRSLGICWSGGGRQSRVQHVVMFSAWHADQWPADDAVHFSKDSKHVTGQYRWQGSPLSDRDCTQQWLYSGRSATGTFLWMDIERDGGHGEGRAGWLGSLWVVGWVTHDPYERDTMHLTVTACPIPYTHTRTHMLTHPESWYVGQWVDGLEI